MTSVNHDIAAALKSIRNNFPQRKREAEKVMRTLGLDENLEMRIDPPTPVKSLPTFDGTIYHKPTPMIQARFDYAGNWDMAHEVWLDVDGMNNAMQSSEIRLYHDSLRENWEDSAPKMFSDDKLTLFGVTDGVPENLTYLVWNDNNTEPGVTVYQGMAEYKFPNLLEYLVFVRDRK